MTIIHPLVTKSPAASAKKTEAPAAQPSHEERMAKIMKNLMGAFPGKGGADSGHSDHAHDDAVKIAGAHPEAPAELASKL